MTTSALPHLRPLSLAELLDQAIRLYRRNFLTLIAIVAIVYVPLTLVQTAITAFTASDVLTAQQLQTDRAFRSDPLGMPPGYWINAVSSFVFIILELIFVSGVGTAAITRAVADNYLGQPIGVLSAYRNIAQRWRGLVRALLYSMLFSILLFLWMLIPCIGWLSGPGMLGFYSAVMVPLFAAIAVLEGKGARATVRRAWDLSRRRFWWLVGFSLILTIFSLVVISGPTLLTTLVVQWFISNPLEASLSGSALIIQTIITQTVSLIFSLIYLPLSLVCHTLLYFDLRIRTEGLDLALQAPAATEVSPAVSAPAPTMTQLLAQAPESEKGNWVTGADLATFMGLTIGVLVLYFGFFAVIGGLASFIPALISR